MRYARFKVDPRMISPVKVARRLGVTPAVFDAKRAELEASGFPKPDLILGTYLLEAVDRWIDSRLGSIREREVENAQAAMLQAVRDQPWNKPRKK